MGFCSPLPPLTRSPFLLTPVFHHLQPLVPHVIRDVGAVAFHERLQVVGALDEAPAGGSPGVAAGSGMGPATWLGGGTRFPPLARRELRRGDRLVLDDGVDQAAADDLDITTVYNPVDDEYRVVWSGDDNTAPLFDNEFEIFGQRLTVTGTADIVVTWLRDRGWAR